MIIRAMRQSFIQPGHEQLFRYRLNEHGDSLQAALQERGIDVFSIFIQNDRLFCYMESGRPIAGFPWPDALRRLLVRLPEQLGANDAVHLQDIYHSAVPQSGEIWRDKHKVEQRIGCIAQLEESMYASYVYYHYQRQEERPVAENKTYMIGSIGRTLFSYQERPIVREKIAAKGLLDSTNTPQNWREVMAPHFQCWPEHGAGEWIWKRMELLACDF